MSQAIAIVGLACRYPDAREPGELWENVLGQRRSFRRLPAERLRLEDYYSEHGEAPDSTYSTEAALIEGYEFDRVRFRVGGRAFRSADLAHWLALDVASAALEDAGYAGGEGLPRDETGVLVGNTLTGELSRATLMRLRWPYVRRQVRAALAEKGWSREQLSAFLDRLEESYKEPFPETTEDSLAGGLSNTIAGRICNHFDLHGGGYTVDGACSSSLLAVANACSTLAAGDLDLALAGGVDVSLDPFELVGFARTRALAKGDMRVYDQRSAGFLPGEGCGFVVLMRHEEALARGRRIYAVIRGWGISSDGRGGLTRPEVEGQLHAVRRAYRRAGFGIDTLSLIEGHGTGTAVGDATELAMLNRARREASGGACRPAAIGSIKANIGHTKAAAAVASLIKATMAIHHQVLPPTTGCVDPHPELRGKDTTLRVLRRPELWPADAPLRAGVSAMGFGGINAHVVLEGTAGERRRSFTRSEQPLLAGRQDAELLLFAAAGHEELGHRLEKLEGRAGRLSRAELTDLAADLARQLPPTAPTRAAVVAATPQELQARLGILRGWLDEGETGRLDPRAGVFLGGDSTALRIGFLFPGQGSPAHLDGGLWRQRFTAVDELYARAGLEHAGDGVETSVAQPAIATACLAALRVLDSLGIEAAAAIGHSLGELVALCWAGAYSDEALLRIATARGRAMSESGHPCGAMASLGVDAEEAGELLAGLDPESVLVTGYNSPRQTVVSGTEEAVEKVVRQAQARGWRARKLRVSHAFHSPLVAAAAPELAAALEHEEIATPCRRVSSTITGGWLADDEDLRSLLCRQVTSPVRFTGALEAAAPEVDVFLEVGPGDVLSALARQGVDTPVVALDAGGESLRGLLQALGSLFALGAAFEAKALFADRFIRPFDVEREPRFVVNPCELAPRDDDDDTGLVVETLSCAAVATPPVEPVRETSSPHEVVRLLLAERTELPPSVISDDSRLLSDLHLNSIAVGEIVADASRRLGLPPPAASTEYANVTVGEVAGTLEEVLQTGDGERRENAEQLPAGVDAWVRPFTVERVASPGPRRHDAGPSGQDDAAAPAWRVFAPADHPFRNALEEAFEAAGEGTSVEGTSAGAGVVLYLPPAADERQLDLLLQAGRARLQDRDGPFVLVHHGGGAAGFARTLHLEAPGVPVTVVELPATVFRCQDLSRSQDLLDSEAATWSARVKAEALATSGYSEACYDREGRRSRPVLRLLPESDEPAATNAGLEADDVVLVTGGGKGIGAECAMALARRSGVRLVLLGRSAPEDDAELRANLERFNAFGATFLYLRADVTDRESVRRAVERASAELGDVRAILHSAGTNVPKLLEALERDDFERTLAPKVGGLRHLLDAVDRRGLKLVVGFGSIIARTGLRGEADYALANEWLRRGLEELAAELPDCRCLCVEWSVWSGVGMGARLSRLETLSQQGISPIPPEEGVQTLLALLERPTPVSVVVTGRFGQPPTLEVEQSELPLLRFLERPRVCFPGVELVADCPLSSATDPYLADHVFEGERLFPAVMGLEAMAQAWYALAGKGEDEAPPVFHRIRFQRPISVPAGEPVTLRLAALVRRPGEVEVVLRSDRTGFQIDHFRAVLKRGGAEEQPTSLHRLMDEAGAESLLPLEPSEDLYGPVLFQAGRFRRLRGYRQLRATQCLTEVAANGKIEWFSPYLSADLRLGDPGMRDACIHSIQACIPHATVLPVGVERLVPGNVLRSDSWRVMARERSREGRTLIYDLEVRNEDDALVERWERLELRIMDDTRTELVLAPPLLGPYLERRLQDFLPEAALSVAVELGARPERRERSDHALRQVLGRDAVIHRRPDGKPETAGDRGISVSHSGDLVVAIAGHGSVGCDLEPVTTRSTEVWSDLLGRDGRRLLELVAREAGEDRHTVATRLWTVLESLKKVGARDVPFVFSSAAADGWVFFSAGRYVAATVLLPRAGSTPRLVFTAVVERGASESLLSRDSHLLAHAEQPA